MDRARNAWRYLSRWPRRALVGGLGAAGIVAVALAIARVDLEWLLVPAALALLALLTFGLSEIPRYQTRDLGDGLSSKERFESENDARRTLVQLLSGLGIVATVAITLYQTNQSRRASERTLDLTAEGQVTERLSRTVEQLSHTGSRTLTARIGAIYTLQKMGRNRQVDRQVVGDLLSAYVQSQRPAPATPPEPSSTACTEGIQKTPSRDIDVALKALSALRARGPLHIDLSRTDLQGASLRHASLRDAVMTAAVLVDADLSGTDFGNADLSSANLAGACLVKANLRDASLQDASADNAEFDGATLIGAQLQGLCARGASFREVRGRVPPPC
jgi:Pentapeptide repeats (8 copies)